MSGKIRQIRIAKHGSRRAKGQTLAIVALVLGLGVLIGLVAIAFDGGSALLQRRAMQNGADAGSQAGIDYMSERILITCAGNKCRPSYGITNAQLRARVEQFVAANRGGTIGTPVYTTRIEYHYMLDDRAGTPPSGPCSDCYMDAPVNNNVMPEFIDGLRVTAIINNPTTFAGAIPNPISDIRVSAVAAARLFSTCAPPTDPQDATIPFTRFRPALERQIRDPNRGGNTYCKPFLFWQPDSDLAARDRNFMNVVSFNTRSFETNTQITNSRLCPEEDRGGTHQLLSRFDCRKGPAPPTPPAGGLVNHSIAAGWSPFTSWDPNQFRDCLTAPEGCADLRGSRQSTGDPMQTDIENWLVWRANVQIDVDYRHPSESMTWYPALANQQSDFGRNTARSVQRLRGSAAEPGDWAEALFGNLGNNVNDSLRDTAAFFGTETEFSPPPLPGTSGLGWGKALRATVYVWGVPETTGQPYSDDTSAQDSASYTINLPGGLSETKYGWADLRIISTGANFQGQRSGGPTANLRVRFTKAYTVIFYDNLQGNCSGCIPFPGCPAFNPQDLGGGSRAVGFIINPVVSDPPPGGNCPNGWQVGGGVYSRQVEP